MAVITRRRGRTYADELIVTNKPVPPVTVGTPIDITDHEFVMHVTTDHAPDSLTPENLLYSVTGVILDAVAGRVEFPPSPTDVEQDDGDYVYEVVMTDPAGRTRTIALDKYTYY